MLKFIEIFLFIIYYSILGTHFCKFIEIVKIFHEESEDFVDS